MLFLPLFLDDRPVMVSPEHVVWVQLLSDGYLVVTDAGPGSANQFRTEGPGSGSYEAITRLLAGG